MTTVTYRFDPGWQLCGILAVVIGIAFPPLMYLTGTKFDMMWLAVILTYLVGGVWEYAYFRDYALNLNESGFIVYRLGRKPSAFNWKEVAFIKATSRELHIRASDGRKIGIARYFPGHGAVLASAKRHVPEAVWLVSA